MNLQYLNDKYILMPRSNILSQFYSMLPVGIIRYDLFGDMIITI